MPITINGSGTLTGVSVGGLPDGIVDTDMIAASAVTAPKRGAGAILQVVQGIKKDTASNSTGARSWYETGITTSITPSNASNKIWLTGYVMCGIAGPQTNIGVGIYKAGSLITGYQADASGSRTRIAVTGDNSPDGGYLNSMALIHFNYLDTAGGTSAITYGIGVRNPSSITRTVKINYAEQNTDDQDHFVGTSVITAMEVAA